MATAGCPSGASVFFYKAGNNNTQLGVWEQLPLTSLRPKSLPLSPSLFSLSSFSLSHSLFISLSLPPSLQGSRHAGAEAPGLLPLRSLHFLSFDGTSCHASVIRPWRGSSPRSASCRMDSCADNSHFPLCSGNSLFFFTHSCSNVFSFFLSLHFVVDFSIFLQYAEDDLGSGISVKTFCVCSSRVAHEPKAIRFQSCDDHRMLGVL